MQGVICHGTFKRERKKKSQTSRQGKEKKCDFWNNIFCTGNYLSQGILAERAWEASLLTGLLEARLVLDIFWGRPINHRSLNVALWADLHYCPHWRTPDILVWSQIPLAPPGEFIKTASALEWPPLPSEGAPTPPAYQTLPGGGERDTPVPPLSEAKASGTQICPLRTKIRPNFHPLGSAFIEPWVCLGSGAIILLAQPRHVCWRTPVCRGRTPSSIILNHHKT